MSCSVSEKPLQSVFDEMVQLGWCMITGVRACNRRPHSRVSGSTGEANYSLPSQEHGANTINLTLPLPSPHYPGGILITRLTLICILAHGIK